MICAHKNKINHEVDTIGGTLAVKFPIEVVIIWIARPGWLVWIILCESIVYLSRVTYFDPFHPKMVHGMYPDPQDHVAQRGQDT